MTLYLQRYVLCVMLALTSAAFTLVSASASASSGSIVAHIVPSSTEIFHNGVLRLRLSISFSESRSVSLLSLTAQRQGTTESLPGPRITLQDVSLADSPSEADAYGVTLAALEDGVNYIAIQGRVPGRSYLGDIHSTYVDAWVTNFMSQPDGAFNMPANSSQVFMFVMKASVSCGDVGSGGGGGRRRLTPSNCELLGHETVQAMAAITLHNFAHPGSTTLPSPSPLPSSLLASPSSTPAPSPSSSRSRPPVVNTNTGTATAPNDSAMSTAIMTISGLVAGMAVIIIVTGLVIRHKQNREEEEWEANRTFGDAPGAAPAAPPPPRDQDMDEEEARPPAHTPPPPGVTPGGGSAIASAVAATTTTTTTTAADGPTAVVVGGRSGSSRSRASVSPGVTTATRTSPVPPKPTIPPTEASRPVARQAEAVPTPTAAAAATATAAASSVVPPVPVVPSPPCEVARTFQQTSESLDEEEKRQDGGDVHVCASSTAPVTMTKASTPTAATTKPSSSITSPLAAQGVYVPPSIVTPKSNTNRPPVKPRSHSSDSSSEWSAGTA